MCVSTYAMKNSQGPQITAWVGWIIYQRYADRVRPFTGICNGIPRNSSDMCTQLVTCTIRMCAQPLNTTPFHIDTLMYAIRMKSRSPTPKWVGWHTIKMNQNNITASPPLLSTLSPSLQWRREWKRTRTSWSSACSPTESWSSSRGWTGPLLASPCPWGMEWERQRAMNGVKLPHELHNIRNYSNNYSFKSNYMNILNI